MNYIYTTYILLTCHHTHTKINFFYKKKNKYYVTIERKKRKCSFWWWSDHESWWIIWRRRRISAYLIYIINLRILKLLLSSSFHSHSFIQKKFYAFLWWWWWWNIYYMIYWEILLSYMTTSKLSNLWLNWRENIKPKKVFQISVYIVFFYTSIITSKNLLFYSLSFLLLLFFECKNNSFI